jgi:hypothetical protein
MPQWTQINVECPDCGVLRITMRELTVLTCVENQCSSYRFRCTTCGLATVHRLDEQATSLLVAHGAAVQTWRLPAELAEHRAVAAQLTPDDLLDFHLLLQTADWFDLHFGQPVAEHLSPGPE